MEQNKVRRTIARLAVAVMAADGRITAAELAALGRLDGLGLGPFADVVREEIQRATREPIDVRATCAELPPLDEEAAALVLTTLAEAAASDRLLAPREREVFDAVADQLGVGAVAAARVLGTAVSPVPSGEQEAVPPRAPGVGGGAPDPSLRHALRVLGLEPGAGRSQIETNYLDLVQRYDPARVAELGAEFAALAVHRLSTITDAYEVALASLPG